MIRSNLQEGVVVIADVVVDASRYHARPKDDSISVRGWACHLVKQVHVVLPRNIRKVDRSSTDAAGCRMKAGVVMHRLEHVPVRKNV